MRFEIVKKLVDRSTLEVAGKVVDMRFNPLSSTYMIIRNSFMSQLLLHLSMCD